MRVSAIEFTRVYLEAAVEQTKLFMEQKKSKFANQIVKEVHNILMELLLERLTDVDPAIRRLEHDILKHLLLEMET